MKFSIRDLFFMTFAVALMMLTLRLGSTISQLQMQIAQESAELSDEKLEYLSLESHRQFHQASIDRFAMVEATGKHAEGEFRKLQERESEIEPIDEQTVSFRTVPMLSDPVSGRSFHRTRIFVPKQRQVYLQLRVVRTNLVFQVKEELKPGIDAWPVTNGGPFQQILPPGFHEVDWSTSAKTPLQPMTFSLLLDQQELVTASWTPDSKSGNTVPLSARDQKNSAPSEPLPELLKVLLSAEYDDPVTDQTIYNCLHLSISDEPSNCPPFPRQHEAKANP